MKNLLLVIILIVGSAYYFVPNEIKIELFEKAGINGSMFLIEEGKIGYEKGEVVELNFDETSHKANFKGNISNGEIMSDLSWASKTYVKCFYSDNYNNFNGNTVLHRILLGKKKDVTIKLITNSDLGMYVYKTDALSDVYPPEKEYVHDCKIDISSNSDRVIIMNGNTVTSDIVIGITGKNGNLEGDYTLEVEEK